MLVEQVGVCLASAGRRSVHQNIFILRFFYFGLSRCTFIDVLQETASDAVDVTGAVDFRGLLAGLEVEVAVAGRDGGLAVARGVDAVGVGGAHPVED